MNLKKKMASKHYSVICYLPFRSIRSNVVLRSGGGGGAGCLNSNFASKSKLLYCPLIGLKDSFQPYIRMETFSPNRFQLPKRSK